MKTTRLEQLARLLLDGRLELHDIVREAAEPATADLDVAQIDLDRGRRCGFPEVIFSEGKSIETLAAIFERQLVAGTDVLATRMSPEQASQLCQRFPTARYNATARTLRIDSVGTSQCLPQGKVAVITAGTSDLPVAEEARETLEWMGVEVTMVFDVGVAGPHRLPEKIDRLQGADAVVVVAGMEGALPSVVGGHVACPVIGVPTSVGYGANFAGLSALLSMLNSCAANVTVVNIDAGFKGGYVAGMIARRVAAARANADRTS